MPKSLPFALLPLRPESRARRSLLLAASASLTGLTALSLAGCGFELRKAPVFAFKTVVVLPAGGTIARLLSRTLPLGGNVTLLPEAQMAQAEAILQVLSENQERAVLSTNSSGQVREIQLRLRVKFRLVTPAGKELLLPTEIQQSRDISYNESAALAKEAEEQLLFRDMQNDIVQQVLRRVAAVK